MSYVSQQDPIETHRVIETRPATCEKHGAFEQRLWGLIRQTTPKSNLPMPPFLRPFWSKCPACNEEIQRDHDEAQAKARGTTNEAVRLRRLLQEAGVPPRFHDASLFNFNTALPKQKNVHQWASNYAFRFEDVLARGRSFALVGNPGTGKTHLAVAIVRHVLTKGGTARYSTCFDLLSRFKATFGAKATESDAVVLADYTRCDLLVVDEIGRQQDTTYDQAALFRVLDHRYQNQKPTLLLTNLPGPDFAAMVGEAIIDRLREGGGGKVAFEFGSQRSVEHSREARQ